MKLYAMLDEAQVAQAESIIAAILAEADAVLSGWNAASEISVINRRAETSGIALSEALYTVLAAGTTSLRALESAAFLTSFGVLLDDLDRPHEALDYLRAVVSRARNRTHALRNLASVLL